MHPFDEVLNQVVDYMLAQKNCEAANQCVRDKLVHMLRLRLREIAVRISNTSCHAGRSAPSYFDVERAFQMLGIGVTELQEQRAASEGQVLPAVSSFSGLETSDEDFHQSTQVLELNKQRGTRSGRHIPKYMPPFPSVHTYRNTKMNLYTDRSYAAERERRAQQHLYTQKAHNDFYLRTEPSFSLFSEPQKNMDFMVLSLNKPEKPAYLAALMPKDEVFEVDIYDLDETQNAKTLNNPFLKEPLIQSAQTDIKKDIEENCESSLNTNKELEAYDDGACRLT